MKYELNQTVFIIHDNKSVHKGYVKATRSTNYPDCTAIEYLVHYVGDKGFSHEAWKQSTNLAKTAEEAFK